jgi:hypothetical protein
MPSTVKPLRECPLCARGAFGAAATSVTFGSGRHTRHSGLLDTSPTGSVSGQTRSRCSAGSLSFGLPTRSRVWLTIGLQPAGPREEAWLKKGLPCS